MSTPPLIQLDRFNNCGFDRGAPVWFEALWWLVRSLFFASWMPVPSIVKVAFLRVFGAKVGAGIVIRSRVNITFPWRLEIADNVWIGDEVLMLTLAPVKIGSNVCVSQRTFLCTGSHDFQSEGFDLITGPITIQDSVWIAAQCFVGPGVTVGTGSMCAAGAVVVRDVPAGVLVGGSPSRVLRRSVAK